MCNAYEVSASLGEISEHFQAAVSAAFVWDEFIYPQSMVPGVLPNDDGAREVVPMQFAFSPHWGKTKVDPKRNYNNARIESYQKPLWAKSFRERRCLVPLTAFQEPSYWGSPAGSEILFTPTETELLGVASIYRIWHGDGQSLVTMAFLMRPAGDDVMCRGHHRMPLFLRSEGYEPWLTGGDRDPEESLAILREFALEPKLRYHTVRQMADSWTSRRCKREAERDKQLANMSW